MSHRQTSTGMFSSSSSDFEDELHFPDNEQGESEAQQENYYSHETIQKEDKADFDNDQCSYGEGAAHGDKDDGYDNEEGDLAQEVMRIQRDHDRSQRWALWQANNNKNSANDILTDINDLLPVHRGVGDLSGGEAELLEIGGYSTSIEMQPSRRQHRAFCLVALMLLAVLFILVPAIVLENRRIAAGTPPPPSSVVVSTDVQDSGADNYFEDYNNKDYIPISPPPNNLDELCHFSVISTEDGYGACLAACVPASCCFSPFPEANSCQDSHPNTCIRYGPCQVLNSHRGREEDDNNISETKEERSNGGVTTNNQIDSRDETSEIVRLVCATNVLESRSDNREACAVMCEKASCCFSSEKENCYSRKKQWCEEYTECINLFVFNNNKNDDGGKSLAEVVDIDDICEPHLMSSIGKDECEKYCAPADCCFQSLKDEEQCHYSWCRKYESCDILAHWQHDDHDHEDFLSSAAPYDTGVSDNAAFAEMEYLSAATVNRICADLDLTNATSVARCRKACIPGACCFSSGVGSCANDLKCDQFDNCDALYYDNGMIVDVGMGKVVELVDDEDESSMSSPVKVQQPPENGSISSQIYDACWNGNTERAIIVTEACSRACAPAACCFTRGEYNSCTSNVRCEEYAECKLMFQEEEGEEAWQGTMQREETLDAIVDPLKGDSATEAVGDKEESHS